MDWQDIKTASYPKKDWEYSEPFLVTNGYDVWATTVQKWADGYSWKTHGASGHDWDDVYSGPTHWMPLPLPPEVK